MSPYPTGVRTALLRQHFVMLTENEEIKNSRMQKQQKQESACLRGGLSLALFF